MLHAGQILDNRYRVEWLLGSGGMADVYLVSDLRLPRPCAVKVLRTDAVDPQIQYRFRREAEILAALRHPHVVDVSDWNFTQDGRPYLVMEFLEGEDLSQFLKRTGPLRLQVALHICMQIGEALSAAHKLGIVHRDLKPANVFLCRQGPFPNLVKVLDFGIAKLSKPNSTAVTGVATVMGTAGYMAPEQAVGAQDQVDERSDQFALAAILYEMLAGHPPFHQYGQPVAAILQQSLYNQPEPLPMPQVNAAVMKALAKKPEDRFADIGTFLAAVGATNSTIYTPGLEFPRRRTDSTQPGELIASRPRRPRWPLALGVALAGTVTAASMLAYKSRIALPAWSRLRAVSVASPGRLVPPVQPPREVARPPALVRSIPTPAPPSKPAGLDELPPDWPLAALAGDARPAADGKPAHPRVALRAGAERSRPAVAIRRAFEVTLVGGAAAGPTQAEQAQKIRDCSDKQLQSRLAPGTTIELVRVSNRLLLSPDSTQPEFDGSGLVYCLERAFPGGHGLPAGAKILAISSK